MATNGERALQALALVKRGVARIDETAAKPREAESTRDETALLGEDRPAPLCEMLPNGRATEMRRGGTTSSSEQRRT